MSRRLTRLLVGLYPPRWRRRYGDELLALAAELERSGRRSRVALALGLIGGAAGQWRRAARWPIGGGVAALAIGLVGLGLVLSGGSVDSGPGTPLVAVHRVPMLVVPDGGTCFVGANGCGGSPCTELIAARRQGGSRAPTAAAPERVTALVRTPTRSKRARAVSRRQCASTLPVRPRRVFATAG